MATPPPGSPSTDAEILVKALRNVISTVVRPSDGGDKHDANQNALGPDGEKFVIALQKFMSSSLRSQRGPVGGIDVELGEKGTDIPTTGSQAPSFDDLSLKDVADTALGAEPASGGSAATGDMNHELFALLGVYNEESPTGVSKAEPETTLDDNLSHKDAADVVPSTESPPDISVVEESTKLFTSPAPPGSVVSFETSPSSSDPEITEQRKSPFIEKALRALHEHVFNTMPIRLLCLQPDSSKLQITLIERGEIYAHIASNLVNGIDFLELYGEIAQDRLEELQRFFRCPVEKAEQMVMKISISKYCKYAVLSHTWLHGESREVTYDDWIRRDFDPQQAGYQKLVNFCRTAWKDYGVAFGWMDTICINKDSSAELDESIRSMYKWYQRAHICITYLADTMTLSDMPHDTWFTRGWTLQELLAPAHIKFYNTDWDKLVEPLENDKTNVIITKKIEEATTITADELRYRPSDIPISRRMQMAAQRQVTREEDTAYSLMGFLDVSIATSYGEGAQRAFSRLLQAVLITTSEGIADVFNWAGPDHSQLSDLLPSSLQGYLDRSSSLGTQGISAEPVEPIMLTHLGLRITVLLMPAMSIEHATRAPWRDYHAVADISHHPEMRFPRDVSGSYSVLDADTDRIFDNNSWKHLAFGVLNIEGVGKKWIQVPRHCLAVALTSNLVSFEKVATEAPITFHLNNIHYPDTSLIEYYSIQRSELESHGMKLDTLIL